MLMGGQQERLVGYEFEDELSTDACLVILVYDMG
jgi:hypothetical protein